MSGPQASLEIRGLPNAVHVRDPETRRCMQAMIDALREARVTLARGIVTAGQAAAAVELLGGDNVRVRDLGGGRWRIDVDVRGGAGAASGGGEAFAPEVLNDLQDVQLPDAELVEGDLLQLQDDGDGGLKWQRLAANYMPNVDGAAAGQLLVWTLLETDPEAVWGWAAPVVGELSAGDMLEWDDANQKWVKVAPALAVLQDVHLPTESLVEGDLLQLQDDGGGGTKWQRVSALDVIRYDDALKQLQVQIAGVWTIITGGQAVEMPASAPAAHDHTLADVTDSGTAAPLNVAATGDAAVGEVVKGDDTRLTDDRDPAAHAASHATGQADAIAPADIGAAATGHSHTLADVTDSGTAAPLNVAAAGDAAVGEVVKGDDSRLTDDRDPAAHNHTLADVTDSGTAAPLNVAATGDAAVGEVVKGDDTRLTDARAPAAHNHTLADVTDSGDAAGKNVGTGAGDVAAGNHGHAQLHDRQHAIDSAADHTGVGDAVTKNVGTGAGDVAAGDHAHAGVYAPDSHSHTLADVTDSGTAAALNVPATGDAAVGEVVKGDDSRLTDDRTPAAHAASHATGQADAIAPANIGAAAAGHSHTLADVTDSGDAAGKNVGTGAGDVAAGDHDHDADYAEKVDGTAEGQLLVYTLISTEPDVWGWASPVVGELTDGDMLEWDGTAKKWLKVTPTDVTVVSDMRYDATNKRLEKKTRSIRVLDDGTESAWTMITGGQAVELP